jgi:hypothetical protein
MNPSAAVALCPLIPARHHVVRNSGLLTGARTRLLSADKKPCRRIHPMQKSPSDSNVADAAPTAPLLTGYDEQHLVTCLRLLDAAADGIDWKKVARTVLHIDVAREPDRARRRGKPISPVPAGSPSMATGICCGAGHLTEGAYRIPQARYRPLPVTSRRSSSPTRS